MKIFITGAAGMVGRALREFCEANGDTVFAYDHGKLDIANAEDVWRTVDRTRPDAVINCAAWTNVDGCESDAERAFAANARGPENLAVASRDANAVFVTISTDYVFDGTKEGFYTQEDEPNPQSVYGRAKLEGERCSTLAYDRSIVVRTGYIFGRGGNNFLSTVVERALKGEKLKAITDTYGTPTYAIDLAERLRKLAELDVPGIYHVVNSGPGVSFEEFTRKAVALIGNSEAVVEPISSDTLNRPAPRPRNSRLRCLRSEKIGLAPLQHWESALEEFIKIRVHP
ncbi:MAG TPA: dTDP-4-dehydrorhamnose reductase, partial [Pyrinomonadaceae bacterium]|nr:dTDP-4-dehydrorhamnose reductase [Pyrinomonadaceae bacterium]